MPKEPAEVTALLRQAKVALAEAMTLADDQRRAYLAELQEKSAEVYDEVISLMSSQTTKEQVGPDQHDFAGDEADTLDQYHTATYDPARTREPLSTDNQHATPKPKRLPIDLVGEDYELEKKIGQGGMGVVYKAYHRSLRRTVALKIITGGGLRDEIDIARFHIEAEAAARLDHPGIIPVYDVGEHQGNHYYAMAYIDGPSLSEYVGSNAKLLPPRRVAELMEQVCHAVQFAHDRAVIHRDLKPANIMLENGKIPRLADFGLAKNMGEEDGLTMTGQVMGTPSYMAPEQATGKLDEISNRTDVYSLGATLYALLAGKPPFSGGTMLETIRQVVRTEPESLTLVSHPVPRDLQTICEKCLAKSPQDRYASADEVAADLRCFLDGFPISARPLAPWARGLRWCQRNPLEAALLGITATALIVGTIVSVRFGLEANRQAATARVALAEANENAQQLRESIRESFIFASEDVLAQEPGMQAAREVLLETAQRYYDELVTQTPRDRASRSALAEAQYMLAKVQMAMGKDDPARKTLHEALMIQKQLVAQDPQEALALAALAKTHNQLARLARKRWQGLTQLNATGKLPKEQAAEAERQLQDWQQQATEVVRLRKIVIALLPEDPESLRLLASATMNQGVAIGQGGFALRQLADQDRARRIMLEAQQIRLKALQNHPEQQPLRRDLGLGYFNLANTELGAADQELTDASYRERLQTAVSDLTDAINAFQQLPVSEQALDTRLELATCYRLRADANFRSLGYEEAGNDYRQAEQVLQKLSMRNPNVYRYRTALAETQFNRCQYLFFRLYSQDENIALVDADEAINQFGKYRETLIQALRIDPKNKDVANQLVQFTQNLVEPLTQKIDAQAGDFELADKLILETAQALLALQMESSEYESLRQPIELLQTIARKIRDQLDEAENKEGVL